MSSEINSGGNLHLWAQTHLALWQAEHFSTAKSTTTSSEDNDGQQEGGGKRSAEGERAESEQHPTTRRQADRQPPSTEGASKGCEEGGWEDRHVCPTQTSLIQHKPIKYPRRAASQECPAPSTPAGNGTQPIYRLWRGGYSSEEDGRWQGANELTQTTSPNQCSGGEASIEHSGKLSTFLMRKGQQQTQRTTTQGQPLEGPSGPEKESLWTQKQHAYTQHIHEPT